MRPFIFIFLLTILNSFEASGDEVKHNDISLQDAILSLKYYRGPYLLYDCKDKHWVCTGDIEWRKCKKSRKKALLDNELNLPCVPAKEYKSEKECVKFQKSFIARGEFKDFCYKKASDAD